MANTLTDLTVEMYNALDVVSREMVGLIPSVTRDMTFERAAKGQTVTSPVAPAANATDITPDVTPPDDGDQVIGNVGMTITKARRVPVRWNGEETLALDNNGAQQNTILMNQFAQAMRTLVNELEVDIGLLQAKFSRAYGAPGTALFSTAGDFTDASFAAKLLKDNGAPQTGNSLVIDTTAGANMIGKQSRYDVAGETDMQRRGVIADKAGFAIRESAAITTFGSNIITGVVTVTANEAIGQTTINLTTAAGAAVSGLVGDIVTLAGDSEKYVLAADATIGASTTGDIVIAEPGLRAASLATTVVSGVAATARNMAFAPSAIAIATRAPALPKQGDSAVDRMIIQDPVSGLAFEVSMYAQYRQMQYEVALAWGADVVKTEHGVLLIS